MNINLAWALAGQAISHKLNMQPLPRGTSEAEVGRWRLVINNSSLEMVHSAPPKPDISLPMMEIYCEHLDYLSFGLLGPAAGMIGGYSEEQFIADMVEYLPTDALEPWRDEIELRKETKQ